MKLLLPVLVGMALSMSGAAFAADSGCGLGNIIIQKNSKGLQLLSWTTNGVLLTQPLGITSGTSGCSASGLVKNDQQMEYFVEVNHDDLTREMAQGEGEKLTTLAVLNGCKTSSSQKIFAEMTQKSYEKIIPASTTPAVEMVQNLKKEMSSSQDVSQACELAQVSSL